MAIKANAISIPLFAETQIRLLQQEHEVEISSSALASITASTAPSTRRTLQATGHALTGIILAQCRTGLGGRVVGEFTADPAIIANASDDYGAPRLGAHGIRVGDNVRVNDTSAASGKKSVGGKDKSASKGPEGVVAKVGERSIFVAFGQRGNSTSGGDADEEIEELWGKKLWLYVFLTSSWLNSCHFS